MKAIQVLLIGCILVAQPLAIAESRSVHTSTYKIELLDGSFIFATPKVARFPIRPWGRETKLPIDWSLVDEIHRGEQKSEIIVALNNGDRISGVWAHDVLFTKSAFGDLRIPTELIAHVEEQKTHQPINLALGKPVIGQDGASHGKGLAKHLTDGDLETHAKPPASQFDYTIQLSEEGSDGCHVGSVKIHWGRFGDRFKGIPASNGDGWSSAAWPGEYVTSYQLDYREVGSDGWKNVHQWTGRPVDEVADHVEVQRLPTELAGCSSESITTLRDLELDNVAGIRIQAKGHHWIGLHELEVFAEE